MTDTKKVLVSLSGGMDSSTLIASELCQGNEVSALFFNYPSKHNCYEKIACERICHHYEIELIEIDLSDVFSFSKSSLINKKVAVPKGHYEDPQMESTVIPGRNLIFITVMARIAWEYDIDRIAVGVQRGDAVIYPDCREQFIQDMQITVFSGTGGLITLKAPFIDMNKFQILETGLTLGVPYQHTRTCYQPRSIACGKCGACVERLEAFKFAQRPDPLQYET